MNEEFYKALGNAIKDVRIEKRMTQMELADKLKLTRPRLANWEQGRRKMNIDELIDLAHALGTTADELIKKAQ